MTLRPSGLADVRLEMKQYEIMNREISEQTGSSRSKLFMQGCVCF